MDPETYYAEHPEEHERYLAALAAHPRLAAKLPARAERLEAVKTAATAPAAKGQEMRKLHELYTQGTGRMLPLLVSPYTDNTLASGRVVRARFTQEEMESHIDISYADAKKVRDYMYSLSTPQPYIDSFNITYDRGFDIQEELLEAIKDEYTKEDLARSNVPIYFVLYTPSAGGHLSLVVHYGGLSYSLGLGYYGQLEKTGVKSATTPPSAWKSHAAFYNPDYLVSPLGVTSTGVQFSYRLVDFGAFTMRHVNRIRSFNVATDRPLHFDIENRSMYIPLTATYSKISNKLMVGSLEYVNCTSFLAHVFSERIDCSKAGIDMPWECETAAASAMGGRSLNDMFNLFISGYRSATQSDDMKQFLEYQHSSEPGFIEKYATKGTLITIGLAALSLLGTYVYMHTQQDGLAGGRRSTRKMKSRRAKTRRAKTRRNRRD